MDRRAWQATVHGDARVRRDLVTKPPPPWQSVKLRKNQGDSKVEGKGYRRVKIMKILNIQQY